MIVNVDTDRTDKGKTNRGFTLVELLVVISIISLILSILLPALKTVRQQGQTVGCMNNIKQLGLAFILYSGDYNGYAMPATAPSGVYWWGKKLATGIDQKAGFVWPYLKSKLAQNSVYECPSQPYGSYQLQGKPPGKPDEPKWITSTYGYNGYYLSPAQSGWYNLPGPWQKIANITVPTTVLVFADTLIDYDLTGKKPLLKNNYSLDPPYKFNSGKWEKNISPTTCFRHNQKVNAIFVDGHGESVTTKGSKYMSPDAKIGSIGTDNAPYYVPNYLQWSKKQ